MAQAFREIGSNPDWGSIEKESGRATRDALITIYQLLNDLALHTFKPGTRIALTAADAGTVDAVYGAAEAAVINNIRTRLGELEAKLISVEILR